MPLPAALLLLLLPRTATTAIKGTALVATLVQLVLALIAYTRFEGASAAPLASEAGYEFIEKYSWISLRLGALGNLQINYFLGADGLNISLVLLAGIVLFIGAVSSWSIKENLKG